MGLAALPATGGTVLPPVAESAALGLANNKAEADSNSRRLRAMGETPAQGGHRLIELFCMKRSCFAVATQAWRLELRLATVAAMVEKKRCFWASGLEDPDYIRYHDEEWGRPSHDDRHLFELLILEGAQAGLSWSTILHKRANYRKAFAAFDPKKVARFDDKRRAVLMKDAGIVRNRLKIESAVTNAQAFLQVQKEFGSFDRYLWNYVEGKPLVTARERAERLPASTDLSDRISKDLKKRGFRFVGTTIIYAFLQAVGVVNDHSSECFLAPKAKKVTPAPAKRQKRASAAA
jgi:DNA-3-methyladenine glycosylase I